MADARPPSQQSDRPVIYPWAVRETYLRGRLVGTYLTEGDARTVADIYRRETGTLYVVCAEPGASSRTRGDEDR